MRRESDRFATTHWSIVLAAGRDDAPEARQAMDSLCRVYWYPLYAYVRRLGYGSDDAQDSVQGFFTRLIEKGDVAMATAVRGRFRSFLLTSLKHFLCNEWDRARAQKRGGARIQVPITGDQADSRYSIEPADALTPERLYERQWAMTLLETVLTELAEQYASAGKGRLFERLKPLLAGESADESYASLAVDFGMTASAIAMAVHRLRQRYRALLRSRIASTVASDEEIEDEIRFLFDAVRGRD